MADDDAIMSCQLCAWYGKRVPITHAMKAKNGRVYYVCAEHALGRTVIGKEVYKLSETERAQSLQPTFQNPFRRV